MPLTYPAPPGTVAGWEEITQGQGPLLGHAISLLQQTSAGSGYGGYSVSMLVKKMKNPQTSPGAAYPGLRVWRYIVPNQDMVALFILRAKNTGIPHTPAYALSVGLSGSVRGGVYDAVRPLCKWMIGQPPQRLEILSEHEPVNHPILAASFGQIPANTILGKDIISPGFPWPNNLHRWRLQP